MSTENSRDPTQPSQALSPLLSPLTHSYLPSHFCGPQEEAPGRKAGNLDSLSETVGPRWPCLGLRVCFCKLGVWEGVWTRSAFQTLSLAPLVDCEISFVGGDQCLKT